MSLKISKKNLEPLKRQLTIVKRDENDNEIRVECWKEVGSVAAIPLSFGIKQELKPCVKGVESSFEELLKEKKKTNLKFEGNLKEHQVLVFKEAMGVLERERSVFLSLYCSWGKTFLSLVLASKLGLKTLILTHLEVIKDGWVNEIKGMFPGVKVQVQPREQDPKADIIVSTVGVARSCPSGTFQDVGVLIVDEARCFCTEIRSKMFLEIQPLYSIALSADIQRPDGMHELLGLYFGPILKRISTQRFTVYKVNVDFTPKIINSPWNQKIRMDVFWKSQSMNLMRNALIVSIALQNPDRKIIIMSKRKVQLIAIYYVLKMYGEDVSMFMGAGNCVNNSRILLTTEGKGGIGFDDKNAVTNWDGKRFDCLIMATSMKDPEQKVGRVFRTDREPIIYDIVDDSGLTKKWFSLRLKWYKSRQGVIEEMFVPLSN